MIGQDSKENFEINFSAESINAGLLKTNDRSFCLMCKKRVELMDYGQTAEYFKLALEDICVLVEKRKLHRIHNKSGATMICVESLSTLLKTRATQRLKPAFLLFNPADYETSEDI